MIIDKIANIGLYAGLRQDIRKALEFLKAENFETRAAGRYPLEGDMYYMVQDYETKPEAESFFEAHRKFIDVQCIVRGSERHGYANIGDLKPNADYDGEKDFQTYSGSGGMYLLEAGTFAVYFPTDGHMPNVSPGKQAKVRKVVVKVPV